MGQGKDERKKGSAVASAVVAGASVALGYAALELGLGGVLKPGREAIKESLDPAHEDAEARIQADQLVKEVDHDAAVHENTTHSPMPEQELAASLQHHAAAAGAPTAAPPASST